MGATKTLTRACASIVLLALAASSATAANVDVTVGLDDGPAAHLRYFPETAVVWEGDTVTWKTGSFTPHTVTQFPPGPQGFDSSPGIVFAELAPLFGPGGFLLPGTSANHTFADAGTFAYFCKIHPGMVGVVEVVDGGGAPTTTFVSAGAGSGDATLDRFLPANVTITRGSEVVWTNPHTGEPHTVTVPEPGASATAAPEFDTSPVVPAGEPPGFTEADGTMTLGGANKEFRRTFTEVGTFEYFCKLHPGMHGTVIVLDKPEPPAETRGSDSTQQSTPAAAALVVLGTLAAAAVALRRRT